MSPDEHDRPDGVVRRLGRVPGRVERVERRVDELREHVLAALHLVTTTDEWRHEVDGELAQLREVLLELNHEFAEQATVDLDALADGVAERHRRVLEGRLETVMRALAAPARQAAFDELVVGIDRVDDLEPGLSVLVASWNHATRLDAALDSACAVTDASRVIVLDDASTDDTPDVLAGRDEPLRIIRSERNLGLTRARNILLHACTTRRAVFLDADNRLDQTTFPDLVAEAHRWDATVAHGVLIEVDEHDQPTDVLGATAMNGAFFTLTHNLVDTLAVIDVATARSVGGYTLDPALETAEDWDMWHRLAATGGLLLHVPIVVGRKLRSGRGHNSQPQDHAAQFAIIDRAHRFDGRLDDTTVASAVVHPDAGPLWASQAAAKIRPALDEALPEPHHGARLPAPPPVDALPPTLLVVAAGGVRNLGDDVTGAAAMRRIADAVGDDVAIEVITDGPLPLPGLAPGLWLGPLHEFAHRPLTHHVGVVFTGGGTMADAFTQQVLDRAAIADQAERAGLPILLTGQGLGPLETASDPARRVVGRATAMTCRDPASADLARGLGCDDVIVVGDDAADPTPPSSADLPRRLARLGERGWVAFHGRLSGYGGIDRADLVQWARIVDRAAADRGLPVVAVALNRQPPWEVETLADVADEAEHSPWLVVDLTDEPRQARAAFGLAAAAVVRSYHAAWFAIEGGAPVLLPAAGDYYRGKAAGLRELADLDPAFDEPAAPVEVSDLESRWRAVAERIDARPLSGVDDHAAAWLRTRLDVLVGSAETG